MFSFHWPWMALLLLLPLLVRLVWTRVVRQAGATSEGFRETLLHPALENLERSFGGNRPSTLLAGRLYKLAFWLLWLLLTLAMMRPQWLEPWVESRTEGYDLMLAVDASHSMEALDFTVNNRAVTRMAVLKGVMDRFIANRAGDRVGLLVFGSQAYTISPLTYDLEAVRRQLAEVVPNIAGEGTAMGDVIALGVKKLRSRPPGSRVLILAADGGSNEGSVPPLDGARMAAQEGIRIYTIGVGSTRESVPILEEGRLVTRDDLGLDEPLLQAVSSMTEGAYFRATDTRALEQIYRRIGELEKTRAESRTVLIPHPLYHYPLAAALALWMFIGLFPEGRSRTLARNGNA